jgi:hypothetical protein
MDQEWTRNEAGMDPEWTRNEEEYEYIGIFRVLLA